MPSPDEILKYQKDRVCRPIPVSLKTPGKGKREDPQDYASIGTGRLLTPHELDRRITAVTGGSYQWEGPNSDSGLTGDHNLIYGGIDSDAIMARAKSPTSFFPGVQRRIANQVSCERVAADLYCLMLLEAD